MRNRRVRGMLVQLRDGLFGRQSAENAPKVALQFALRPERAGAEMDRRRECPGGNHSAYLRVADR